MFQLQPDLAHHFRGHAAFDQIVSLSGEVFRQLEGRKTLRFARGGQNYFAKIHLGVGWREILKNMLCFRRPVVDARNEWRALQRLKQLGIDTMEVAGYGQRGSNPACRQSFLITRALENTVSLEDFCRHWPDNPPPFALKRALIEKTADIARRLHENGVNHRDFYICHFLLDWDSLAAPSASPKLRLFLIDLHRAQVRTRVPRRWLVKDLAGLLFSSSQIGLTRRDLFRFLRVYREQPLRRLFRDESRFWRSVVRRAETLTAKHS